MRTAVSRPRAVVRGLPVVSLHLRRHRTGAVVLAARGRPAGAVGFPARTSAEHEERCGSTAGRIS